MEGQILPGIAAYETLQTVMSKEEARKTVHDYVEQRAWKLRAIILKLMRVPGLYRLVPGLFTNGTRKMFGETAGFAAKEYQTSGGVWQIDMVKCPYHDTCVQSAYKRRKEHESLCLWRAGCAHDCAFTRHVLRLERQF